MDLEVLQDLQDYYADLYRLTIFVMDLEGDQISDSSGENPVAELVFKKAPSWFSFLESIFQASSSLPSVLTYDVFPGLKAIIAPFKVSERQYYVWAGVFIEEDIRAL